MSHHQLSITNLRTSHWAPQRRERMLIIKERERKRMLIITERERKRMLIIKGYMSCGAQFICLGRLDSNMSHHQLSFTNLRTSRWAPQRSLIRKRMAIIKGNISCGVQFIYLGRSDSNMSHHQLSLTNLRTSRWAPHVQHDDDSY